MTEWLFAPARFRRLLLIFLCTYYAAFVASRIEINFLRSGPNDDLRTIDFQCFWLAGRTALLGQPGLVYDFDGYFSKALKDAFGDRGASEHLSFVYPPQLLLYLAPFSGLLPLMPAMALWLSTTFLAAWAALRRIGPWAPLTLLGTVPSAVAFNVGLGQTSFLVTALLGFSLALVEVAPLSSGLVLGLLTYKPQFGLIFPIVLLCARQWRVLLGASISATLLAAATTLVFGHRIWLDFYVATVPQFTTFRPIATETPLAHTVYGFLVWLDCPAGIAQIIHVCVAVAVVIAICVIWRRPVPYALKAAALAMGALIATPYFLAYDLVALAVPAAFLIKDMQRFPIVTGERYAAVVAWLILFALPRPVSVFAIAILFAMIARRAFRALPSPLPDKLQAGPIAL